jgi:2-oxoglutarate ferredoxin oxidoreductase subunit beta
VLSAAAAHRGTAFVEIFQNCPIFNDGAFDDLKGPDTKQTAIIPLVHGEPIRFGPLGEDGLGVKGVVRDPATGSLRTVDVAGPDNPDGTDPATVLVHDAHADDPTTAFALSRLTDAGVLHQSPIGIFRQVARATYDDQARSQISTASAGQDDHRTALTSLISGGDTWTVV